MKKTGSLLIILVILASALIILNINYFDLRNRVNSIETSSDLESNLEERFTVVESELNKYSFENIERNISQLGSMHTLELSRMEDLINRVEEIDTLYGQITGVSETSSDLNLDIVLADSNETIRVYLEDDCSVYMISENGLVLIDLSEFKKNLGADLDNGIISGYTFKLIEGKVVHIYQGWGSLK